MNDSALKELLLMREEMTQEYLQGVNFLEKYVKRLNKICGEL